MPAASAAFSVLFPTFVATDYARGAPVASVRSGLLVVGWLAVWAASVAATAMTAGSIVGFWRAGRSSGLVYPGEEKGRARASLLFTGRMHGPGTYRFDNTALVLSARVLPSSTTMAMAWAISALLFWAHTRGGEVISVDADWSVIYLFAVFAFQTGVFCSKGELRLERSNIEDARVDGARVTLEVRGLFQKRAESVGFVVSRAECPTFFSGFQEVFPGLLPEAYAETARRAERFQRVNRATG